MVLPFRHASLGALALIVIAAGTSASPARAAITQVSDRAALGANLTIDWSAFGLPGSIVSTPQSEVIGPETVAVGSSQGQLARYEQGLDITRNFAAGDQLLADAGSLSDSFLVRFAAPVGAVGTQMVRHSELGGFTGHMYFYDTSDTLLGEVTITGSATAAGDDSAPFIGGVSSAYDISWISLTVDNDPGVGLAESGDLLINRMDVRAAAVPEPAGIALFGSMLAGMLVLRRGRRPGRGGAARL